MRIVFLGTPAFAVPSLQRLAKSPRHAVTAVVCQPDRPAGRGGALSAPAVKRSAEQLGLPVYQPESLRADGAVAWLHKQNPDALAVVAFGQLLPRQVFDLPRHGAINAHASLLPLYRGAAPIQWSIAAGDNRTGVTTMRIDAGLDTGDILLQRDIAIAPDSTAPELSRELAELSAGLLEETFDALAAGAILGRPQGEPARPAPMLTRADGKADWRLPAEAVYNRWRGFQPWPGLWCRFRDRQLTIVRCEPAPRQSVRAGTAAPEPGRLLETNGDLYCRCGDGELWLQELRLEGRRTVSAEEFIRGARMDWGRERLE